MAVLLSGTTIGGHVAVHANNISTYALTSVPANVITTSGGTLVGSLSFADVADNVRFQKGSNHLNLKDPWSNFHLYIPSGGIYSDAAAYYFRNTSSTVWLSIESGNVQASSSMRAPIFYDSQDTEYYVDPNSNSRLNVVRAYKFENNDSVSTNSTFGIYFGNGDGTPYAIYRAAGSWTHPYPDLRIAFHTGIQIGANASYEGVRFYTDYDMSSQVMSVNNGSDPLGGGNVYVNNNLQAGSSLRAPIFYDSNDTNYYVDPNGNSVLTTATFNVNASSTIAITSAGTNASMIKAGAGDELYLGGNDTWQMRFNGGNVLMDNGGYLQNNQSLRAPIFYDSNDTGYYGDFASTSRFSRLLVQQSGVNSTAGPALRVSKGWDNGTPDIIYDTVVIESNDVTTIRMKEADGGTAGWSTGDGNTSFTSNVPMRFYTGGSESAYIYSGQGGTLAMYINNSQIVGIGTSDFSYTANDNSRTVGSTTNNRLFVNGSIQLLGNNDAIVIGRGTATFLSDEELGFGWGGGWYMTESSYIRSRGSKSLHMNGGSVDYVGSMYLEGSGTYAHLQPNAGSYGTLQITNSKNGWSGIRFVASDVNIMANTNESGFHNNGYGWQFRWSSGEIYISANANGGGTERTVIHSGNIGSQSVSYASTAGSAPNGSNINSNYDVAVGDGNGLRFWGGSNSYKISMGVGSLYQYGPVTDYSIKMQMNDSSSDRGFTWGRISYAPIAALNSTSGDMEVAGYFKSYGYRGNGNVGGTGTASWHPDGIYCGSTMWQYGTMYKNGTGIYDVGQLKLNNGPYIEIYNSRNTIFRSADNSDAGILGRGSANQFAFQIYGSGGDYGFLDGAWANWDIRKTVDGAMYMNDNNSYYLHTNSTSNFYALNIQGSAVVHAGNIGSQSVSNSNYINSTRDTPSSALQYWQAPGLGIDEAPSSDWHNTIRMGHGSPLSYYSNTLAIRMTGSGVGDIYTQTIMNGNRQGWKKHWNDGNHGSGSGLDADLLDGQQGSYYQPASSAITTSNIGSQSVSYASSAGTTDNIDGWGFRNTGSNDSVNADTIDSNGITYYTDGVSNFSGNATDGALYSQRYSSSWQHQIAGDYRSGQIALRGRNNGTWQAWRTVLDSSNFSTWAATASHTHSYLPLSGGDLTGSIGVPSGSSVFLATSADTNWRIGRNLVTESDNSLTGSTMQFIAANVSDQGWQFVNSAGKTIVEISSYTNGGLFVINQKEFWLKQPIGGRLTTIRKKVTDGLSPNNVKIADTSLAAYSANSNPNTYIIIQTLVPQDEYQMGGFTIDLFARYGDTNGKTKIDLGGYWNPEGNGGFVGWEAHGTNPQLKPTIQVARNVNNGYTAIILSGITWDYPVVVARDLYLGYNSADGAAYGFGWHIYSSPNINDFTNLDTVVWRNAYSDSNPAGYITASANTASASVLETARTLTIGSTGKTFNGSANVSWTLAEIGAQPAGSYLTSLGFSYSTGVNANHVVQRDANGYIYANHINFSTGESENPTINSFITSNGDGWSRKSSLAHVKNSIRDVADGTWSINITGDANSVDGVDSSAIVYGGTGRASNYDGSMNDPNQKSGFYFKDNPTGRPFDDWWNWMTIAGNSWQSSNNYAFQISHAFHSDDAYIRRVTNGSLSSWRTLITSGNIGSQSVNYATSAGSAGSATNATNANRLDRYTVFYGNDWNTAGVNNKLIASSFHNATGPNKPPVYTYGGMLSYMNSGEDNWQIAIPENQNSAVGKFNSMHYRSGWNGVWSSWRQVLDFTDGLCAIDAPGTVTTRVYSSASGYNTPFASNLEIWGQVDDWAYGKFRFRVQDDPASQPVYGAQFRIERYSKNTDWQLLGMIPRGSQNLEWQGDILPGLSDGRVKENVTTLTKGLETVKDINAVEFDWIPTAGVSERTGHDIGFIAQELEEIVPEAVYTRTDGYKTVRYEKVVPVLVQAIKDQQSIIDSLISRIEALENK